MWHGCERVPGTEKGMGYVSLASGSRKTHTASALCPTVLWLRNPLVLVWMINVPQRPCAEGLVPSLWCFWEVAVTSGRRQRASRKLELWRCAPGGDTGTLAFSLFLSCVLFRMRWAAPRPCPPLWHTALARQPSTNPAILSQERSFLIKWLSQGFCHSEKERK